MASAEDGVRADVPPKAPPVATLTPEQRDVAAFFALCLVEARRYGDDASVWIRELTQNARDADASTVTFSIEGADIIIDDDGTGMSHDVVRQSLLRLFSSQKGQGSAVRAAGCFGVGFWSLLLAGPRRIEIDTRTSTSNEGVGVVVDVAGAAVVERPCQRGRPGTTVRLVAPRERPSAKSLHAQVRHHASMVQGLTRPITVRVGVGDAAVVVNEPFSLAGLDGVIASVPIAGDGFVGFVGLSSQPRVELFHHGLRVVEASSLSALVPSLRTSARPGLGLVARVDVPGLRVLVDRRTVVEDDTVTRVVRACERAANALEYRTLDSGAPLPWHLRILDVTRRLLRSRVGVALAIALCCVAVGFVLGSLVLSVTQPTWWRNTSIVTIVSDVGNVSGVSGVGDGSGNSDGLRLPWPFGPKRVQRGPGGNTAQTLSDAQRGMGAPRIDVRGQHRGGFSIVTRHVHDDLSIDVRSIPDDIQGLRATPDRLLPAAPARPIAGPARASAQLLAKGKTIVPSSLVLWPIVASADGHALPIGVSPDGLPVIDAGPAARRVDVFFAVSTLPAPPPRQSATRPSSPWLDAIVRAGGGRRDVDAVRAIADAVGARVHYAADARAADAFATDTRPFLDRVFGLGFGDCDVLNTVVVLALQQAGFEARLARGLVVRDDRVASELHAWAEVYADNRWLRVDISPIFAVPRPSGEELVTVAGNGNANAFSNDDANDDDNDDANDDASANMLATAASPPRLPTSPAVAAPRAGVHASAASATNDATDAEGGDNGGDDDNAFGTTRADPPPTRIGARAQKAATNLVLRAVGGVVSVVIVAAVAVGIAALWRRRRRHHATDNDKDDDGLTAVIVAGLKQGAGERLGLFERPIVPSSHGRLSLRTLRRLASTGRLATTAFNTDVVTPSHRVVQLDLRHPRVAALRPWLPPVVDDSAFQVGPLTPRVKTMLDALQRQVDVAYATVTLRSGRSPGIREVHLLADDGHTHHVMVGPDILALPVAAAWRRVLRESTSLWRLRGGRGLLRRVFADAADIDADAGDVDAGDVDTDRDRNRDRDQDGDRDAC